MFFAGGDVDASSDSSSPIVEMDWKVFDPWHTQSLRHRLCDHPLLQVEELVELGRRCRGTSRWASFNNDAGADANFDTVSSAFPSSRSAVDSLKSISDAKAWVLLRHIQADDTYRPLVDLALDAIQPHIEVKDPGMYYRAGWIFAASPHTVTPFHIDRNHGILLQISGSKKVYVWDAEDTEVVSDLARDCFHSRHDLGRVQWHEEFRARAHVFDLEPGTGVYIPLTSPHMVETTDDSSITISLTYSTKATRHNAMQHVMNDLLRRTGLHPPPVGSNRIFDRCAYVGASAMVAAHGPGSRSPACPSLSRHSTYAVAD